MSESTGPASADHEVTIRRAPRIGVFLVVGAMLGTLVTLILTSLFEPDPDVGFIGSFGYFLMFGIPGGVLIAALVALIIDAVSRRRTRSGVAVRDAVEEDEHVEEEPLPDEHIPDEDVAGDDVAGADAGSAPSEVAPTQPAPPTQES